MISVHCQCGAKYQAQEASAGNRFTCKKCGRELKVPDGQIAADSDGEQDDEDLPKLPSLPSKKAKKKPAVDTDHTDAELPKRPAKKSRPRRESDTVSSGGGWAYVLTGDIRPLLVSGACVLIGIAAIVFPFVMGPFDPQDLAKEPGTLVSRNERTGAGLILAMYNTFGQAGVTGFFIVIGLAAIAGGVWFFRNYDGESDD